MDSGPRTLGLRMTRGLGGKALSWSSHSVLLPPGATEVELETSPRSQ